MDPRRGRAPPWIRCYSVMRVARGGSGASLRYARGLGPVESVWRVVAESEAPRDTARMATAGKRWRHVILSTRCSWLHGDPRGFRSRDHRIHSSGDYKNPPPQGEHAGLLRYQQSRAGREVHLPIECRPLIGRTIVEYLNRERHRVLAVAIAKVHVHLLVELPDHMALVRQIAGHAKRHSSRAIKSVLPGNVWGEGGKFKPVRDLEHQRAAFDYILYEQGPEAWTWSYRDGSLDGVFGRKRPKKAPLSHKPRAGNLSQEMTGPRRRGSGPQTRRDDEAIQPKRIVEGGATKYEAPIPGVPTGWAASGPPASFSLLNDSTVLSRLVARPSVRAICDPTRPR